MLPLGRPRSVQLALEARAAVLVAAAVHAAAETFLDLSDSRAGLIQGHARPAFARLGTETRDIVGDVVLERFQ